MLGFDFRQPLKMQRQLIALNAAAALVNLALCAMNIANGKWIFLANLASGAFSAWVTWRLWKKLPEIKRQEQERILTILKGQYDPITESTIR